MNYGFGTYLKEYLEFNNISQTEFANRLNITQKHMNEILNGKSDITLEMAANIHELTKISRIQKICNRIYIKKIWKYRRIRQSIKKRIFFKRIRKKKMD